MLLEIELFHIWSYIHCILRASIHDCACTIGAELAIFEIIFYRERNSDLEGSDALHATAFTTESMGLWQLWTSNLALILLTAVSC